MLRTTASALKGVPSWKVASSRNCIVRTVPSSFHDHSVASCGMISSSGEMSTSLSHIEV